MYSNTITRKLNFIVATSAGIIIVLAVGSFTTQMELTALYVWVDKVFSMSFVVLYSSLLGIGITAAIKLREEANEYWLEIGQQTGNVMATLALTYTLLGISMGIGSLADQQLSSDTVNAIIGELTRHFSIAFMTTIVGLPTSNIIRAWVSIEYKKHNSKPVFQEN